ncbi:MAG: NAD(P)H-binding protein [Gammaproteobacteria bacterium]
MKVFLAGATGALGKQLVPQLVSAGHEVTGMTRSRDKADLVRSLGARPVVADALDPDAVGRAISEAAPDAVVHELTAIPQQLDIRRLGRAFALTNRLRTEGTDNLLSGSTSATAGIEAVSSIVNPDKLERLGPVADVRALLRGSSGT